MCNIAGYIGKRDAAPILIEMMLREEGFGGGFFSGIATVDGGRIEYAKCAGDMAQLLKATDAKELGGNVGIIHSRSQSGGDDEWAHPFISSDGHIAYCANGEFGNFTPLYDERTEIFERVTSDGYSCRSLTGHKMGAYPYLKNGHAAHVSDVMAQLIARNIAKNGDDAADAMENAFCEMRSEIVGLALYDKEDDCILWSRINQPMHIGYADHGAYLATTAMAFPKDVKRIEVLPEFSSGRVYADGYTAKHCKAPFCTVAPITPRMYRDGYDAIVKAMKGKRVHLFDLMPIVNEVFDKADCYPYDLFIYSILGEMRRNGLLVLETEKLPATVPNVFGKKTYLRYIG